MNSKKRLYLSGFVGACLVGAAVFALERSANSGSFETHDAHSGAKGGLTNVVATSSGSASRMMEGLRAVPGQLGLGPQHELPVFQGKMVGSSDGVPVTASYKSKGESRTSSVGRQLGTQMEGAGTDFYRAQTQDAWERFSDNDDDQERTPITVQEQENIAQRVIDRVKFARHRQDLPSLIYDTSPEIVATQTGGVALQLRSVKEGSIISDAGLRSGDVIKSINGQPFKGADAIPSVIEEGLKPRIMQIEVERNGKPMLLEVGASYRPDEDAQLIEVAEEVTKLPPTLEW